MASSIHDIASLYNTLPTLGLAEETFDARESVFDAVGKALRGYHDQFGLYLVHAHCKLNKGEIMVADGDTSEPTLLSNTASIYPEVWLADGRPIEFTTRPTVSPPPGLIADFKAAIGDLDVLGLSYIGNKSPVQVERTEGRKNITEGMTGFENMDDLTETQWAFVDGIRTIRVVCLSFCDSRITRSGRTDHKGTKTHHETVVRD